eukprot:Skav215710  [mRNA]  locus=scaffold2573:360607:364773:+ [translate_table: standard]
MSLEVVVQSGMPPDICTWDCDDRAMFFMRCSGSQSFSCTAVPPGLEMASSSAGSRRGRRRIGAELDNGVRLNLGTDFKVLFPLGTT